MSAEEEQQNELEALAAIFDKEFQVTSESVPRSFELTLVPNADGENNHVCARLVFTLPAEYPFEGAQAQVRVVREKGLSERQQEDIAALVADRVAQAASSGEVAAYLVAEAVREYLSAPDVNVPALSMHAQMAAREAVKISEEEEALMKRRALEERIEAKRKEPSPLGIEPGTLLTPESFAAWRALFDAEQKAIREAKEALKPRETRLTGKQLFMANLAKELGDEDAEELEEESSEAAKAHALEAAKEGKAGVFFFNEGLFTDDLDEEGLEEEGEIKPDYSISSDDDDDDAPADETVQGMFDASSSSSNAAASASAAAAAPKKPAAASSSSSSFSSASAIAAKPAAAAASSYKPAPAAASASSYSAGGGGGGGKDKEKEDGEKKKKKEDAPRVMSQSERDKMLAGKAANAAKKAQQGGAAKGKKK